MKKVLVIRYGGVGDIITTLPVIKSLKKSGYSVVLVSNSRYKGLWKYMALDVFICVDNPFFLPAFAGENNPDFINFINRFDIVISYTDKEEIFSRTLKRSFRGTIIFHPVSPERIKKHIVEYLLEPVHNLTDKLSITPELKINPPSKKEFFVIHPGSGSIHKNWEKERFLTLYKRLSTNMKGIILLGYAENQQRDFWYKNIDASNIVETESLECLIPYAEKAHFYIGNDSGVSHLFSAAGVPSVVIFGPTSPFIWSPRGKNVKIVYKAERCSPCSIEKMNICKEKSCLNSITVDDVIGGAKEIWKKVYGSKAVDITSQGSYIYLKKERNHTLW